MLHHDERTGAEHYVVRYRPGTKALPHRHTAAHTIIVLDGHLSIDGQVLGPGGYAHHPGGTTMLHEPAPAKDAPSSSSSTRRSTYGSPTTSTDEMVTDEIGQSSRR